MKRKDFITILAMILATVLGTINLIIEELFELILPLWGCTLLSIPLIYFAYSLAKRPSVCMSQQLYNRSATYSYGKHFETYIARQCKDRSR